MKDIYRILDQLNIAYTKYTHPAVFTAEEAKQYDRGEALSSKNLFLRNKKGNKYFLVVVPAEKRVSIQHLEQQLGEKDLSFASPERLVRYLGVTPGSVSPFGLLNDESKEVVVVVDQDLLTHHKQSFHPNDNTATLVIATDDFKKFLEWTANNVRYLSI